jgi:hypothetical protein
MTSRTTGQLRSQTSSSTLKSYYDPKKFPLAISQQTSDSAIRDMALRKDKPPVIGTSPIVMEEVSPDDEMELEESIRKRKPGLVDFSRIFSKPNFSSLHLLSSTRYADSTSQLSGSTDFSPLHASALRSMTSISSISQSYKSGNKLSKSRPGDAIPPSKSGELRATPSREDIAIFKSHVRRPPRGVQHWFDGLLEEEDEFDSEEEEEVQNSQVSIQTHQKKDDVDVTISQPNQLSSRQLPQMSDRPTSSTHRMSLKSQHSVTSSHSRSSTVARSNLRESIISSSTVSTDDDDDNLQSRDSIAISEIGETIVIGKAQAFEVKPLRKLVQEQNAQRRTSSSSSILSNVTASSKPSSIGSAAHIIVPTQSRIKMTRHTRQPSSIPEDSDENSKSTPPSNTPQSTGTSMRSFHGEGHKLMAVTAEEEALLEMMRRKRAAMAKHSFAEGYRTALQQETKRSRTPSRQRHPAGQPSLGNSPTLHQSKRSPSLVDNFPISNVQRSSLILAASLPSPPPTSALPDPPIDPPSKRQSRYTTLSGISASSATTKRLSSASSASIHGHVGAGALPNTKLSTTLSPLSVDASSITPSVKDTDSQTTSSSSGSQPSPLPSPVTPQTHCGSRDDTVIIKPPSSTRDASPSSIKLDSPDRALLDEAHLLTANKGKCCNHNHKRTASSDAKFIPAYNSTEVQEPQRPVTAPLLHSENKTGKGISLRTSASTLKQEICVDRSSWRQSTFGPLTRCSVSEDVLSAWTDLGGWRGYGYYGVTNI